MSQWENREKPHGNICRGGHESANISAALSRGYYAGLAGSGVTLGGEKGRIALRGRDRVAKSGWSMRGRVGRGTYPPENRHTIYIPKEQKSDKINE
jgi:hypothetical protein